MNGWSKAPQSLLGWEALAKEYRDTAARLLERVGQLSRNNTGNLQRIALLYRERQSLLESALWLEQYCLYRRKKKEM